MNTPTRKVLRIVLKGDRLIDANGQPVSDCIDIPAVDDFNMAVCLQSMKGGGAFVDGKWAIPYENIKLMLLVDVPVDQVFASLFGNPTMGTMQ